MTQMSRKAARKCLFELLFEKEFRSEDTPEQVYISALEDRDIPEDEYIRGAFFGICEKSEALDMLISKYARGWRADRLSKVSRSAIRLSVYEILYTDIPTNVSVSEAVDIAKKYGEEKARAFVNGVLASIVKDINACGRERFLSDMPSEDNACGDKAVEVPSDCIDANSGDCE